MARMIDADKLKTDADITNWGKPYGCSFRVIDIQPTVDAESVRYAKRIIVKVADRNTYGFYSYHPECSECGNTAAYGNYCSNCGAKFVDPITK